MNDICCIGHITLDKIVTPRKTTYMPGGTSYYFSHGISHLKDTKHYQLVTALAPSEFKAVEDIRAKGIKVTVIPSHRTVYFENTYGENQDNRSQRVLAKADPFTVEQLENINAHIFHLGSLLADDFSLDVVKYLSTKGILAVDGSAYRSDRHKTSCPTTSRMGSKRGIDYIGKLRVYNLCGRYIS